MISTDAVKALITAMCAAVEVPFVRAEQDGKRSTGIFLSYKIIQQTGEPVWQRIEENNEDGTDPANVVKKVTRKSHLTASCTVLGPSAQNKDAWDTAYQCLAWLESEAAELVFEEQGLIPKFIPVSVQDRSAFFETGYETRLGFDIQCTGVTVSESDVDAVDIENTIPTITEVE